MFFPIRDCKRICTSLYRLCPSVVFHANCLLDHIVHTIDEGSERIESEAHENYWCLDPSAFFESLTYDPYKHEFSLHFYIRHGSNCKSWSLSSPQITFSLSLPGFH